MMKCKIKKFLIYFIVLINLIYFSNPSHLYENTVSDIEIIDKGESFIELSWINPIIDNDYLEINYRIVNINDSVYSKKIIDKDISNTILFGFTSGSIIDFNFSTFLNNKSIGTTNNFRVVTSKFILSVFLLGLN